MKHLSNLMENLSFHWSFSFLKFGHENLSWLEMHISEAEEQKEEIIRRHGEEVASSEYHCEKKY